MFKEVITKSKTRQIVYLCFCAFVFASCSGGSNTNKEAEALYNSAVEMNSAGNCEQSNRVLDSLSKTFPNEFELIKKGMHLRTLNGEKIIKKESVSNDSLIAVSKPVVEHLANSFNYIKEADMVEGFWMSKRLKRYAQSTSIEPRIDNNCEMYIVSNYVGGGIGHTSLSVVGGNGRVSTATVPYDKARNYRYENEGKRYESITFKPAECAAFVEAIAKNGGSPITISFNGASSKSGKIDGNTTKAFQETLAYSEASKNLKKAQGKKIYLDKKLEITLKQQQKTKVAN